MPQCPSRLGKQLCCREPAAAGLPGFPKHCVCNMPLAEGPEPEALP